MWGLLDFVGVYFASTKVTELFSLWSMRNFSDVFNKSSLLPIFPLCDQQIRWVFFQERPSAFISQWFSESPFQARFISDRALHGCLSAWLLLKKNVDGNHILEQCTALLIFMQSTLQKSPLGILRWSNKVLGGRWFFTHFPAPLV